MSMKLAFATVSLGVLLAATASVQVLGRRATASPARAPVERSCRASA